MRKFVRIITKLIRKKENVLVELLGIVFSIIVLGLVSYFYFCGVLDTLALLQVVFAFLLAFLPIYLYLLKKRNQTLLITFTCKYLLEGEESKIDELLGVLIAGKWEKLKIDPVHEFFKCVKKICLESTFEMRRRISEALPALFKIDLEAAEELAFVLRRDWDERWKSDNRRRMIESLLYVVDKDKNFVRENLHIVEGDEIFTVIAVVELLDFWKTHIDEREAEALLDQLSNEMKGRQYSAQELIAISELWNLLHLIRSDPTQAIGKFEQLKDNPNIYVQISAARNLKHLWRRFPEKTLDLMESFLGEQRHKNVRRPIAKEDSVECLTALLTDKKHGGKAKEILWKLITDKDDIIRLATFDKIEKILDIDGDFGKVILQHVVDQNRHPKLVERARVLLKRDKT